MTAPPVGEVTLDAAQEGIEGKLAESEQVPMFSCKEHPVSGEKIHDRDTLSQGGIRAQATLVINHGRTDIHDSPPSLASPVTPVCIFVVAKEVGVQQTNLEQ